MDTPAPTANSTSPNEGNAGTTKSDDETYSDAREANDGTTIGFIIALLILTPLILKYGKQFIRTVSAGRTESRGP